MHVRPGEQRLDNLLKRDLFCKLRDGDGFPEEVREIDSLSLTCCDAGRTLNQVEGEPVRQMPLSLADHASSVWKGCTVGTRQRPVGKAYVICDGCKC